MRPHHARTLVALVDSSGYPNRLTLWDVPDPAAVDPLGGSVWLREPMRPIVSENLRLQALLARREKQVESAELSPVERDTIISGRKQCPGASDDDPDRRGVAAVNGGRTPQAFNRLVERVDAELGDGREYAACMTKAGFPSAAEG